MTLSDMIFQDRLGIDVICVGNVKEFIQNNIALSRKIKGADGDWINVEVFKEQAGDALIHSPTTDLSDTPEGREKVRRSTNSGTPEDSGSINSKSSGTSDNSSCANLCEICGQCEEYHIKSSVCKEFKPRIDDLFHAEMPPTTDNKGYANKGCGNAYRKNGKVAICGYCNCHELHLGPTCSDNEVKK